MEQTENKITPKEHDHKLYLQAMSIKFLDWDRLNELMNECLTDKRPTGYIKPYFLALSQRGSPGRYSITAL